MGDKRSGGENSNETNVEQKEKLEGEKKDKTGEADNVVGSEGRASTEDASTVSSVPPCSVGGEASQTTKTPPPSSLRRCKKGWIESYFQYTIDHESPDLFHIWTAISVLAGALRNNVLLDRNLYKLYPNHYVVLVAESGLCRKTTALEIAPLTFLQHIPEANMLTGSLTAQGLYDAMNMDYSAKGKAYNPRGAIYVLAGELTYAIREGAERDRMLQLLTDFYGGKAKTHDITRQQMRGQEGRNTLENVCLNFFTATTQKSLAKVISLAVAGVGFVGRTIWIVGEGPRKSVAWPEISEEGRRIGVDLLYDLKIISRLKGVYKVEPEAKWFYKDWYDNHKPDPDTARTEYEREYLARKGEHVLKLAMIMSVNERNDLVMTKAHIVKALKILAFAERDMWKAFKLVGTDASGLAGDLLSFLAKKPSCQATITQLVSAFRPRIRRREDLDASLELLREEGLAKRQYFMAAKRVVWILTEEGVRLAYSGKRVAIDIAGITATEEERKRENEGEGEEEGEG